MATIISKAKWLQRLKQPWSAWLLPVIVALYITLAFNTHIYQLVTKHHKVAGHTDMLFLLSAGFLVFYLVHLVATLFSFGKGRKAWLMLLLVLSAGIAYMHNEYNVLFDETMFQNIMETDVHESSELLSLSWLFYILVLGAVPAFIISRIPVEYLPWHRDMLQRLGTLGVLTLLLLVSVFPFYQDYASLFRSNRSLKDSIVPTAFLYAGSQYIHDFIPVNPPAMTTLGTDATTTDKLAGPRKTVTVIVVGETARAANFSLSGYTRPTNPLLQQRASAKHDILYYSNFHSCGTSTSISVPCIFSYSNRSDFDANAEKYNENLLDVFAHAGLNVSWIDNNSGCKGVCSRIHYVDMRGRTLEAGCDKYGCSDMMLVHDLEDLIHSSTDNIVVVLHQKGSHGPSYYERVPQEQQVFQPTCHTSQLQECTHEQIVNSYDNTIVYTDFMLENVIETLEKHAGDRDAMMFYVSDHGESLGENNLYLHGMPYSIAPDEQTHVPAILWLSEGFRQRFGIDETCLRNHSGDEYSHDNVYHTLLGLLDIQTSAYDGDYDMSKPCRDNAIAKTPAGITHKA